MIPALCPSPYPSDPFQSPPDKDKLKQITPGPGQTETDVQYQPNLATSKHTFSSIYNRRHQISPLKIKKLLKYNENIFPLSLGFKIWRFIFSANQEVVSLLMLGLGRIFRFKHSSTLRLSFECCLSLGPENFNWSHACLIGSPLEVIILMVHSKVFSYHLKFTVFPITT